MEKKHIIINIGSTSKRYAFFLGEARVADFHMAKYESGISGSWKESSNAKEEGVSDTDFADGVLYFLKLLAEKKHIAEGDRPDAIAIRVVAPDAFFTDTRDIDDEYIARLEKVSASAPLHVVGVLEEVKKIKESLAGVRITGVSDSRFHEGLPEVARSYPLPKEFREKIPRFGYHGISLASSLSVIETTLGNIPKNIIICHLGGGSSITAIQEGKSVDTSMGFSPQSGIPMTTRSGTIDTGALFELSRQTGKSNDELEMFLNTQCGLVGLSGGMADVKQLIVLEKEGNEDAKRALDYFAYSIQKYIGSYIAVLGGLDLLVFSGSIGVGSDFIREKIVRGVAHMGILLDSDRNKNLSSESIFIEATGSKVKIAGVEVDEIVEMQKEL